MANEPTVKFNTGFFSLLFLIFLTLKLCKVITWSWWWVFAPIYMPVGVVIAILLIIGIFMLISGAFLKYTPKRRK